MGDAMKIYFCNAEPIDLNAIAIMGVSVKTGDNPIGYFGTGLKFAIAMPVSEANAAARSKSAGRSLS